MNGATVTALVVAAAVVGIGALVRADLIAPNYASIAIGVVLGSGVSGGVGFALGKKAGAAAPPEA